MYKVHTDKAKARGGLRASGEDGWDRGVVEGKMERSVLEHQ